MAQEKVVHYEVDRNHVCAFKCISWSAIIIGTLFAIGFEFLINLFGFGIGLAAYSSNAGTTTLEMGGFIAAVLSVMIPLFFAGFISGYIGRLSCVNERLGLIYGFTTWCLALVVSILLVSSAAKFVTVQYETFTNPTSIVTSLTNTSSSSENTVSKAHENAGMQKNTTMTQEESKSAAKSLLMLFLLFFVGALSSSYGGYVGMRSRE